MARCWTSSGLPYRSSKRLGSPSFRRTPIASTPQCTNSAVPGTAAATATTLADARIVECVAVHGREQADDAHAGVRERFPDPRLRAGCRRIDHEVADEPRRVAGDRLGHRGLVAGDAGNAATRATW